MVLLTSVKLGIYDADTGRSVIPEKALDMSDMSPVGQSWMLVYARAQRGLLVKVILYYGDLNSPHGTVETHWFVDGLDEQLQMADTIIPRFARDIGFTPEGLVAVIRKHAPTTTGS